MLTHATQQQRREVPLGRSALWLCVGLGFGSALGACLSILAQPDSAQVVSAGLRIIWPLLIGGMAVVLLVIGTLPGDRITLSRAAAARIEEHGIKGLARIRAVAISETGAVRVVSISLDARSRKDQTIHSDLVWRLDAVDAQKLRPGGVIPVRFDPAHTRRIIFDSRADSRNNQLDPNEVFSVRNRFRSRVHTMRPFSHLAIAVGGLTGFLVGYFF